MPSDVYALVPAAGLSMRLSGGKQSKLEFCLPNGRTVLEQCLASLIDSEVCKGVVVASREGDMAELGERLGRFVGDRLDLSVVAGGEDRQGSVFNALSHIKDLAEFVLVHDAARPCCSPELIRAVVAEAQSSGAAILAEKCSATVKLSDSSNTVVERTIDRDRVWLAQTPQVFKTSLLLKAYQVAEETGFKGTDESSLVENLGEKVSLVEGSSLNIKLTTKEDLRLVEQLIAD